MIKRKRSSCQGVKIVKWRHFEVEWRTLATKIFDIPVRVHEYYLCSHPSRLGFTLLNFPLTLWKWKWYICSFFNALHAFKNGDFQQLFYKKKGVCVREKKAFLKMSFCLGVVDFGMCPVIKFH